MAIIGWPDDIPQRQTIPCVVCGEEKEVTELSAGMCDLKGEQQFACDSHFLSSHQFITGWADFLAAQQQAPDNREPQGLTWG